MLIFIGGSFCFLSNPCAIIIPVLDFNILYDFNCWSRELTINPGAKVLGCCYGIFGWDTYL